MLKIEKTKNLARLGKFQTKNGELQTPFFMPDATRGFVKFLSQTDLRNAGIFPMVVNTYHLYLQPGMEVIKKAGGIHKFMHWSGPLLSDSGGYQIFSLIHKNPEMGRIIDEKAIFKSPVNGKKYELTPERSIQIQFDLGVDMMVVLDDVPPVSYADRKTEIAVKRTIAWAKRCKVEYEKQIKERKIEENQRPLLFGVIQGGKNESLRRYCAEELVKIDFDGYGFGARHIDEEGNLMEDMIRETAQMIPENKLRFALGVGTPRDIVKFVSYGWDMFDCVIPTREGRHGRIFLWKHDDFSKDDFYETININNEKYQDDFSPIDAKCSCELCANHTKGYLRHLFFSKDPLGMRLAAIHNLRFYMELMDKLRKMRRDI